MTTTDDPMLPIKAKAPAMRTPELLERLRRHYIKPGEGFAGGIFVPECGWNGATGSRCDALYAGFTSTSGRRLIGHELKVSRADWRHELDQLEKADPWHDNCHAWYVVAPSEDVVPRAEVPAGWGLMVPGRSKTRMQVIVRPVIRDDVVPSWHAVRSIMARQDTLNVQARHELVTEVLRREQAVERTEKRHAEQSAAVLDHETRTRLNTLEALEKRIGVDVVTWTNREHPEKITAAELAAAVSLVRAAHNGSIRDSWAAHAVRDSLTRALEGMDAYDEAMSALRTVTGDVP